MFAFGASSWGLGKRIARIDAGRGSDERGVVLLRRRRGAESRNHPLRATRRLTMRRWPSSTRLRRSTRRSSAVDCAGPLPRAVPSQLLDRSPRSGNWSNGGVRHAAFAGSSGCRSTRRCSTTRVSRRTATAAHARSRARVLSSLLGLAEVKRLLRPSIFGRWNDVEGLGVEEELPSEEPALGRIPGNGRVIRLSPGATAKSTSARPSAEASATPSASGCASDRGRIGWTKTVGGLSR